jgi:hypothetical protein
MRSFQELRFRLRQEAVNAFFYAFPPRRSDLDAISPLSLLPNPDAVAKALHHSHYEVELVRVADQILQGRIPILGTEVEYGSTVAWRRDPLRGTETSLKYFRLIPFLDLAAAGDHKLIWEVNRHQHLVALAQAFVLTGREAYFEGVTLQLTDWWSNNLFQRGINWASALEVAARALSWTWVWHLLGSKMSGPFRQRFLSELYRHGLHLQYNLSLYFSPNTHLLGEAVALHALGRLFPDWPRGHIWRELGRAIVSEHMHSKVKEDGSYYEQSSYYQMYALDMFVFHAVLEEVPEDYLHGLGKMAVFLAAMVMPDGTLPFLGDDDGGRLFHPFGNRTRFARATLATASVLLGRKVFPYSKNDVQEIALWWLGPEKCDEPQETAFPRHSQVFRDSGIVVLKRENAGAVFDAGAFGAGNAGHSHADALSLVVWSGGNEILIDPGTYSYMDREWRQTFRGTGAHNTIRIDGRDQAVPSGPFRWTSKPDIRLIEFSSTPEQEVAVADCRYDFFTHQRTVGFGKGCELFIVDELSGPPGEHTIEQFWHLGQPPRQITAEDWQIGNAAVLSVAGGVCEVGWRSKSFGSKEESPVIVVRRRMTLPAKLEARLQLLDGEQGLRRG